jgi:hypothetical protein
VAGVATAFARTVGAGTAATATTVAGVDLAVARTVGPGTAATVTTVLGVAIAVARTVGVGTLAIATTVLGVAVAFGLVAMTVGTGTAAIAATVLGVATVAVRPPRRVLPPRRVDPPAALRRVNGNVGLIAYTSAEGTAATAATVVGVTVASAVTAAKSFDDWRTRTGGPGLAPRIPGARRRLRSVLSSLLL